MVKINSNFVAAIKKAAMRNYPLVSRKARLQERLAVLQEKVDAFQKEIDMIDSRLQSAEAGAIALTGYTPSELILRNVTVSKDADGNEVESVTYSINENILTDCGNGEYTVADRVLLEAEEENLETEEK